jgi:hypothetical protein
MGKIYVKKNSEVVFFIFFHEWIPNKRQRAQIGFVSYASMDKDEILSFPKIILEAIIKVFKCGT